MNWNIHQKQIDKWISDVEKDTSNSLCKEKSETIITYSLIFHLIGIKHYASLYFEAFLYLLMTQNFRVIQISVLDCIITCLFLQHCFPFDALPASVTKANVLKFLLKKPWRSLTGNNLNRHSAI